MSSLTAAVRDRVATGLDEVVAEIVALAEIGSGSTDAAGVASVQRHLAERFRGLGAEVELRGGLEVRSVDLDGEAVAVPLGPLLRARWRPGATRRVLLVGHADTVFGPGHPFRRVCRDGPDLHGPGVADMKGGLVLALAALAELDRLGSAPGIGVDVVVVPDEELGSPASSPLLAEAARGVEAALVVEPRLPDGSLARRRSGSASLAVVVTGRGAHAGRALAEGRNAVAAAAQVAVRAHDLTDHGRRLGVNVAALHGGDAYNAVPDRATVRLNVRSPEPADLAEALESLRVAAREVAEAHDVEIAVHDHTHRAPKTWTEASADLGAVVAAVAADLDLQVAFADTGGVCDGNDLEALGPGVVDTLGIGGRGIHTDEERADLSTAAPHAALLAGVLDEIARSPAPGGRR